MSFENTLKAALAGDLKAIEEACREYMTQKNYKEALKWAQEGSKSNNIYCMWAMTQLVPIKVTALLKNNLSIEKINSLLKELDKAEKMGKKAMQSGKLKQPADMSRIYGCMIQCNHLLGKQTKQASYYETAISKYEMAKGKVNSKTKYMYIDCLMKTGQKQDAILDMIDLVSHHDKSISNAILGQVCFHLAKEYFSGEILAADYEQAKQYIGFAKNYSPNSKKIMNMYQKFASGQMKQKFDGQMNPDGTKKKQFTLEQINAMSQKELEKNALEGNVMAIERVSCCLIKDKKPLEALDWLRLGCEKESIYCMSVIVPVLVIEAKVKLEIDSRLAEECIKDLEEAERYGLSLNYDIKMGNIQGELVDLDDVYKYKAHCYALLSIEEDEEEKLIKYQHLVVENYEKVVKEDFSNVCWAYSIVLGEERKKEKVALWEQLLEKHDDTVNNSMLASTCYDLGIAYFLGEGVAPDYNKSQYYMSMVEQYDTQVLGNKEKADAINYILSPQSRAEFNQVASSYKGRGGLLGSIKKFFGVNT